MEHGVKGKLCKLTGGDVPIDIRSDTESCTLVHALNDSTRIRVWARRDPILLNFVYNSFNKILFISIFFMLSYLII